MARAPRIDYPGMIAHVSNRGVARRPVFETRKEMRLFLALLAVQVRRGRIEVLAYALLLNHFHLLLRSPVGELASSMQWVQSHYSRRFNLRHDRDGGLFKGRYHSSPVEFDEYFATVVRYIDDNVVRAGLADRSSAYEFGSAFHFARFGGPPWLTRGPVEREVRRTLGLDAYDPSRYEEVFPSTQPLEVAQVVRARLASRVRPAGGDTNLVTATPRHVRQWLIDNTALADGRVRRRPLLPIAVALSAIDTRRHDAQVLGVALLRLACGMTMPEIARRLGVSLATAHRLWQRHRLCLHRDDYARALARQLRSATRRTYVSGVGSDPTTCK